MRRIEGEQVLMRIFIGQTDRWERRPLYAALLELFRVKGLAGATVLHGVAGFGATSVMHEVHSSGCPRISRSSSRSSIRKSTSTAF